MLKGLQLSELARLRAFWAAEQSPQRPQPCASLPIPTRREHRALRGFPGTPEPDHSFFFSRFCPFPYPSIHFISVLSVDTAAVSLFEDVTYLSPTSSWAPATSGFTFISLAQSVQVKGNPALAHSQGKSRELDSSALVSTSLGGGGGGGEELGEGGCLRKILPG